MIRFLLKSVWYLLLMILAAMIAIYISVSVAIGHQIVDQKIMEAFHREMSQEKAK
jgi:sensor domain CHASE-containing protein